jgi:hypothetical protein
LTPTDAQSGADKGSLFLYCRQQSPDQGRLSFGVAAQPDLRPFHQ